MYILFTPISKKKQNRLARFRKEPFENLITTLAKIEKKLSAPFSVMIHGDFNNDNILYDVENDRVYLIDIHRSEPMDFVQDVSVFIVSNFRMPVTETRAP
jgi:Ser/Thr protein kinase RdoA (MazF antagonist)